MTHTYSHYEKVTMPINRNWLQKLLGVPKELSVWQRRSWSGSLSDLEAFSGNNSLAIAAIITLATLATFFLLVFGVERLIELFYKDDE